MYRIVTQSYPNNEVRTTFSAMPSLRGQADRKNGVIDEDILEDGDRQVWLSSLASDPALSLVLNSKTERSSAGYGSLPSKPTTFGPNARRILMRSGGALEKSISSPGECLFLTATLPGSTGESFKAIAEYSGYIVNSLKAWIANRIKSKLDFYCWEYQKRGALHLHYCLYAQDERARSEIQCGFKNWWIGILHRVGDKTSTDLFRKNSKYTHLSNTNKVRAVAEICRKSPARYLAKYLSKSAHKMKGRSRFFTPSRWWGTSRPLKVILENLTETKEIIQGSYMNCIRKMQQIKGAVESCEGKSYSFDHKYGLGQTLLIYPSSESDNKNLFEVLTDMSTIDRINKELDKFKPTVLLRPHKDRLLEWSNRCILELPASESGLIESLKEFNAFMFQVAPSKSIEPIMIVYEWSNRLYNLNEIIRFSICGRKYSDRIMIDAAMIDLEIAIKYICTHGWE